MGREITIEQAYGKVLVRAVLGDYERNAVLVFSDSTFTVLEVDTGWERGDEAIIQAAPGSCSDGLLAAAGIISDEEANERCRAMDAKAAAEREARERLAYASLKAKYGE